MKPLRTGLLAPTAIADTLALFLASARTRLKVVANSMYQGPQA